MAQQLPTILNCHYEVRSPEPCTVTDAGGIHLCTALSGCMAYFYGDGHPVTLSSDLASMRWVPMPPERAPWQCVAVDALDAVLVLENRCIYCAGELASLTLDAGQIAEGFFCEICFTSGAVPTALSMPEGWNWYGDALSNGVFVPQSNTRYRVVVLWDGVFVRAAAEGVKL